MKILKLSVSCILVITVSAMGMAAEMKDNSQHKQLVVTKGAGAWVYGINPRYVDEVKTFNNMVKDPERKIRYLFCYAGSVEKGKLIGFKSDILTYYKQKLPECDIYPNIDGYPSIKGMSEEQIAIFGKKLGETIDQNADVSGLHLDIEPYEPTQLLLLEEYKKYTDKPVNLSISKNAKLEEKLFQLTNFVVLMDYDYSGEPDRYTEISNKAIEKILSAAKTYDGKAMIGIPAIATHKEFQYRVSKSDSKDRENSGYTMADYLSGALKGCREIANQIGIQYCVGYSIWALHSESEPVGFFPIRSKYVYFPSTIGLKEWELMIHATL